MESILHSLGVDPGAIVGQALALAVMLWALNRFVFGKVGTLIEERRREIEERNRRLAEKETGMARLEAEARHRVDRIEIEAQSRIREAIEEANAVRERVIAQARKDAARELELARRSIQLEKERAIQEMQGAVADLAIMAAGQILGENLDNVRNRKMVDDLIRCIPNAS